MTLSNVISLFAVYFADIYYFSNRTLLCPWRRKITSCGPTSNFISRFRTWQLLSLSLSLCINCSIRLKTSRFHRIFTHMNKKIVINKNAFHSKVYHRSMCTKDKVHSFSGSKVIAWTRQSRRQISDQAEISTKNLWKQECIPVGCIPPTAVAITGGSPHPPPPWEQAPPPREQAPPQEQGPRSRHPPGPDPPTCGQNSWHTLLKILPCPKLRLRAVNIWLDFPAPLFGPVCRDYFHAFRTNPAASFVVLEFWFISGAKPTWTPFPHNFIIVLSINYITCSFTSLSDISSEINLP